MQGHRQPVHAHVTGIVASCTKDMLFQSTNIFISELGLGCIDVGVPDMHYWARAGYTLDRSLVHHRTTYCQPSTLPFIPVVNLELVIVFPQAISIVH